MDRTFILSNVYTSENCSYIKDKNMFSLYPMCAGTLEAVEEQLTTFIKRNKAEGLSVEEVSSEDINAGHYFSKVVKLQNKLRGPSILGIHSVWSV